MVDWTHIRSRWTSGRPVSAAARWRRSTLTMAPDLDRCDRNSVGSQFTLPIVKARHGISRFISHEARVAMWCIVADVACHGCSATGLDTRSTESTRCCGEWVGVIVDVASGRTESSWWPDAPGAECCGNPGSCVAIVLCLGNRREPDSRHAYCEIRSDPGHKSPANGAASPRKGIPHTVNEQGSP